MSQAPAPDDALATRLSASAVLGVAIALLLAMLPGIGLSGARPLSTIGAAHAEQLLPAANRDARADLSTARGPKTHPDFGDAPVLLAAALAAAFVLLAAASLRLPLARAPVPGRRPTATRARAPPRA